MSVQVSLNPLGPSFIRTQVGPLKCKLARIQIDMLYVGVPKKMQTEGNPNLDLVMGDPCNSITKQAILKEIFF